MLGSSEDLPTSEFVNGLLCRAKTKDAKYGPSLSQSERSRPELGRDHPRIVHKNQAQVVETMALQRLGNLFEKFMFCYLYLPPYERRSPGEAAANRLEQDQIAPF